MQASNRTFICSVVFIDIVGYSKKAVSEQIRLKERLNALLTEALANVAVNDRIILDTGDGAALSFLGDPEDALFVSLALRDAIAADPPGAPSPQLRIGINLGPVKLVRDINGQPNIIGDGINVAQRVMGFCQPGQVLVSRSYYEVVSCLSEDYGKLFHYEGSRTDKHVREHEVYAVQATGEALQRVAAAVPKKRPATGAAAVFDRLARTAGFVAESIRSRPPLGTALAVIAILAIAVGIRAGREPAPPPPAAPAAAPDRVATVPAQPPAPKTAARPAPAEKPAPPPRRAAEEKPAPAAKPGSASPATAPQPAAPPARPAPEPKTPAASGTGTILLTVRPWGEVYVDGLHRGDTPPLHELRVSAGKRRLEIRHPDFEPYVTTLDVTAGARIDVRHVFVPKEHPNPLRKYLPWK
jgi:class 3 adenylate cyclase